MQIPFLTQNGWGGRVRTYDLLVNSQTLTTN